MTEQNVSIKQIIQNVNRFMKQYSDKTVQQNTESCLQNDLEQDQNDEGSLKPEEKQKSEEPKEVLEVLEVIRQICLSDGNTKMPSLIKLIKTDEQLIYYTGVNFCVLKTLTESALILVMSDTGDNKKDSTFESVRNRIISCLCKLKRNYSFQLLAVLFGTNEDECEEDFFYMVAILSEIVTKGIYMPSEADTLEILPNCSNTMRNLQFVLHYIEFTIRKTRKCEKCSLCTHPQNKVCKNLKFILAIAPIGLISFVSKTFGGFTPTKVIMNESNLLNGVDANKHAIVINKLTTELKEFEKKVDVEETPQILDGNQVDETTEIQDDKTQVSVKKKTFDEEFKECRVFIDETIEKFSEFSILKGTLPLQLYYCIDEIVAVIAGLINLQDE